MRFVHIADIHLGMHFSQASFGSLAYERRKEIKETFYKTLEYVKEHQIEVLLIAGDLFEDKSISIAELKEVSYKFSQLQSTKIFIIAGNHDPLTKQSIYNWITWPNNVQLFGSDIQVIDVPEYNLQVYGMSWASKWIQEGVLDEIKIQDPTKINILLAHGDLQQKSNYLPINRGKLMAKGFDYVALGHIHKAEFIEKNIAYSGSLEPLDFSEGGDHGFIIGEISGTARVFKFVPFAKRTFHSLSLKIDENVTNEGLKEKIYELLKDKNEIDFYRIRIEGYRDPDIEFDYMDIIGYFYSNGWYIEVIDQTEPSYDIHALLRENEDNIIGRFIKELSEASLEDEDAQNALYYGLEALMSEKVKAC